MTLKPGLAVSRGHQNKNYTTRSGTHDFLLTFHSNHRPISHCSRDKRKNRSKIAYFPPCIKRPQWRGSLWNLVSA